MISINTSSMKGRYEKGEYDNNGFVFKVDSFETADKIFKSDYRTVFVFFNDDEFIISPSQTEFISSENGETSLFLSSIMRQDIKGLYFPYQKNSRKTMFYEFDPIRGKRIISVNELLNVSEEEELL